MTVWLVDTPATAAAFTQENFSALDARHQPADTGSTHFFSTLNGGKPGWIAKSGLSFAGQPDWAVALIDDASRSQFEALSELIRNGTKLPPKLACLALTGRGFRGQRARRWIAMRGNLHLTAHFRIDLDAQAHQAALNMIPSVAVAEALAKRSAGRLSPKIKWVNDVWIDDGKIAGVLTSTSVKAGRLVHVLFGVGLNVGAAPPIERSPFFPRATCVADHDGNLRGSLPVFFEEIIKQIALLLERLASGGGPCIFKRYQSFAGFIGKRVRIWPDDAEDWRRTEPVFRGIVTGLNPDLSLRLEGHLKPITSGRLAYEETCSLFEARGEGV